MKEEDICMAVAKFLGMEVEGDHDISIKRRQEAISWDWNKWVKLEGLEM